MIIYAVIAILCIVIGEVVYNEFLNYRNWVTVKLGKINLITLNHLILYFIDFNV